MSCLATIEESELCCLSTNKLYSDYSWMLIRLHSDAFTKDTQENARIRILCVAETTRGAVVRLGRGRCGVLEVFLAGVCTNGICSGAISTESEKRGTWNWTKASLFIDRLIENSWRSIYWLVIHLKRAMTARKAIVLKLIIIWATRTPRTKGSRQTLPFIWRLKYKNKPTAFESA